MVVLGIILAAAAVGIGVGVVAENSSVASLSVFGQQVPGVNTQAQVFIAGVIVAMFFMVGMTISALSLGRSMRVRRELRYLREEHRESLTELEMEKQQLQRELARVRNGSGSAAGGPPTGGRRASASTSGARSADLPTAGIPTAGAPRTGLPVPPLRPRERGVSSPFFDQ